MTTQRTEMRPILTLAPAPARGLNPVVLMSIMLATALALITSNPLSTLVGFAGIIVLIKYFWTRTQPAVLFWALLHQWLQVNAGLLYADLLGIDHSEVFTYKAHADESYLLGMVSLFALGLGFWLMTHKLTRERLDDWLARLDPRKCLKTYVVFIVSFGVLTSLPLLGVGQAIVALNSLKWGFFYIFFCSVIHTGRYRLPLCICMLLEFVFSLYSIFASFRAILIMPIMLLPVFFKGRIRIGQLLIGVLLAALLINVGIVWTAVKADYRFFMAQGQKGQVINVSRNVALEKLVELVQHIDVDNYKNASIAMVYRLFYLDFLSGLLGNVPERLPYEGGGNAMKSLIHIVTPRILFPEKEALYDSEQLNKYMGSFVADYRTTSMSIGYVGDFYIDFGFFAPMGVFVLGLISGYFYRLLYRQDPVGGWGLFLAMPLFFTLYLFEITQVRMIGLTVTYVIVMLVVSKFLFSRIKRSVEVDTTSRGVRTSHLNPRRARLV